MNPKELKGTAEKMLKSKDLDIVSIISKYNNKVSSVVCVNKNLGFLNAIDLVNIISKHVGGKHGGGRPDMAQSGGQNVDKIDFAVNKLKDYISLLIKKDI